ncbi:MAG TPA: CBS domain-containing protein [Rhizobiales bacterium]|nr:CBS domain-containing protein [Hyphomicrobiales bacterium]
MSERDIVRGLSERPAEVLRLLVSDLMTSNVITENTDTDMCDTMPVMAKNRFRHLPILDDGRLVGMISIRDSLAVQLQERELEAGVLRDNVIAARYR